jgi:hypothetical protein
VSAAPLFYREALTLAFPNFGPIEMRVTWRRREFIGVQISSSQWGHGSAQKMTLPNSNLS